MGRYENTRIACMSTACTVNVNTARALPTCIATLWKATFSCCLCSCVLGGRSRADRCCRMAVQHKTRQTSPSGVSAVCMRGSAITLPAKNRQHVPRVSSQLKTGAALCQSKGQPCPVSLILLQLLLTTTSLDQGYLATMQHGESAHLEYVRALTAASGCQRRHCCCRYCYCCYCCCNPTVATDAACAAAAAVVGAGGVPAAAVAGTFPTMPGGDQCAAAVVGSRCSHSAKPAGTTPCTYITNRHKWGAALLCSPVVQPCCAGLTIKGMHTWCSIQP